MQRSIRILISVIIFSLVFYIIGALIWNFGFNLLFKWNLSLTENIVFGGLFGLIFGWLIIGIIKSKNKQNEIQQTIKKPKPHIKQKPKGRNPLKIRKLQKRQ